MNNLQQYQEDTLKKFDEKLPKLIVDLVWSITDGGCKIKPSQCLTYQDEPVMEYEDIKSFLLASVAEAYEMGKEEGVKTSSSVV